MGSDLTSDEWHVIWRHRVGALPCLADDIARACTREDAAKALARLRDATEAAAYALDMKHAILEAQDAE